jgi:thymidylate synthase ThyX
MSSFAIFIKLRRADDAQVEIRNIAQGMFELVYCIKGNPFQHTLKAIKQ